MNAQLFVLPPESLTHVRLGPVADSETLIEKAQNLASLYPYVTDMSLKTLWVHPDCIPTTLSLKKMARQGPRTRRTPSATVPAILAAII